MRNTNPSGIPVLCPQRAWGDMMVHGSSTGDLSVHMQLPRNCRHIFSSRKLPDWLQIFTRYGVMWMQKSKNRTLVCGSLLARCALSDKRGSGAAPPCADLNISTCDLTNHICEVEERCWCCTQFRHEAGDSSHKRTRSITIHCT